MHSAWSAGRQAVQGVRPAGSSRLGTVGWPGSAAGGLRSSPIALCPVTLPDQPAALDASKLLSSAVCHAGRWQKTFPPGGRKSPGEPPHPSAPPLHAVCQVSRPIPCTGPVHAELLTWQAMPSSWPCTLLAHSHSLRPRQHWFLLRGCRLAKVRREASCPQQWCISHSRGSYGTILIMSARRSCPGLPSLDRRLIMVLDGSLAAAQSLAYPFRAAF